MHASSIDAQKKDGLNARVDDVILSKPRSKRDRACIPDVDSAVRDDRTTTRNTSFARRNTRAEIDRIVRKRRFFFFPVSIWSLLDTVFSKKTKKELTSSFSHTKNVIYI